MIKNYMEILVDNCIEEILSTQPQYVKVLSVEKYLDDVRAMALNKLQPLYVTQAIGEVYGEFYPLQVQNKADIRMECIKALEIVGKNL